MAARVVTASTDAGVSGRPQSGAASEGLSSDTAGEREVRFLGRKPGGRAPAGALVESVSAKVAKGEYVFEDPPPAAKTPAMAPRLRAGVSFGVDSELDMSPSIASASSPMRSSRAPSQAGPESPAPLKIGQDSTSLSGLLRRANTGRTPKNTKSPRPGVFRGASSLNVASFQTLPRGEPLRAFACMDDIQSLQERGWPPEIAAYNRAICTCVVHEQPDLAYQFFQEARQRGLQLDSGTWKATMMALVGHSSQQVFHLFRELRRARVLADEDIFNLAADAAENLNRWENALEIVRELSMLGYKRKTVDRLSLMGMH